MRQSKERSEKIAILNDALRRTCFGGTIYITAGVRQYGPDFVTATITAVKDFDDFDEDNDPYGERDFGAFSVRGQRLFWKIDYYDKEQQFGSEDAADAKATHRVLTVMLAEEY